MEPLTDRWHVPHSFISRLTADAAEPARTDTTSRELRLLLAILLGLFSLAVAIVLWETLKRSDDGYQAALAQTHREMLAATEAADLRLAASLLDFMSGPGPANTATLHDSAARIVRTQHDLPVVALARVDLHDPAHPVLTRVAVGDGIPATIPPATLDASILQAARDAGPQASGLSQLLSAGDRHLLIFTRQIPQGSQQLIVDGDLWLTRLAAPHTGWLSLQLSPLADAARIETSGFSLGWQLQIDTAQSAYVGSGTRWLAAGFVLLLGALTGALLLHRRVVERGAQSADESQRNFSESESRMLRALQLTQEGIWEFDLHTHKLSLSGRGMELLGQERGTITGIRSALRRLPRNWRRELIATALRARRMEGDAHLRFSFEDVRRGERWIDARIRCVRDKAGRPSSLTGTLADITDGMLEIRAHDQARTLLMRVFDTLPVAIALRSTDQKIVLLNEHYARDMLEPFAALATAQDADSIALRKQLEELDQAAVVTQKPQEICLWFPLANGDVRYLRLTRTACDGNGGEPLILSTHEDLSVFMRTAHDMERRYAELQRIFDALPQPLFVKDSDHRYIMSNHAHAASLGIAHTAVLGRRSADFVNEELATRIELQEEHLFANGSGDINESEYTMLQADGSPHNVIIRKAICTLNDNRQVLVGVLSDVTTLRQIETKLRAQRDQLTALVADQVDEIQRARAYVESTNDARSAALAQLSHELSTPLHAVLNHARLGESQIEALDRERIRECLRAICVHVETLMRQINVQLDRHPATAQAQTERPPQPPMSNAATQSK